MTAQKKKKSPTLRFPKFTDDWEQRKWIDTVDISTNMVDPKTGKYNELLHIGPGNIESFTGKILDNVNTVKNDNLISDKFHFNPNDIIYGKINPQLAKYAHVNFEGLASADAYVLNSKNGINQDFLYVELQTSGFYKYSVSVSMRTGMPKINRDELNQFNYLAPKNIEEQQKIGSFFKQLDDTIALHQRKLDLLEEQKKGLLQKMFPKKGAKVPELRFKEFTDDWELRKLRDIANYRNGKAHEQVEDEDGKYTIINSKFISTNGKVQRYTNEQVEPIFDGEIAMVLSDLPNGKALAKLFLVKEDGKYTLNQRIAGITPKEIIDPIFLNFRMNRNNYFLKFDSGVTQTNLSKSQVENFIALYPTFDEQYKIGLFFTQLDNTIALHQRKLDLLKEQKKALLQRMFV